MGGLKEEVVVAGGDSLELAACAEACVSFLLAYLDTTGRNKTTLEVRICRRLIHNQNQLSCSVRYVPSIITSVLKK